LAVCVICDLCLQQQGGVVGEFLSLKLWTPLSHLSFGAYLVHPIVIFVWQLGNTQKETFRFLENCMNYVAVCVVSFAAALLLALMVEFPCAALTKHYLSRRYLTRSSDQNEREADMRPVLPKCTKPSHYGSLEYEENGLHHR
jgi:peptidoglycan/LPS O-acetylase OafA/YrhL